MKISLEIRIHVQRRVIGRVRVRVRVGLGLG